MSVSNREQLRAAYPGDLHYHNPSNTSVSNREQLRVAYSGDLHYQNQVNKSVKVGTHVTACCACMLRYARNTASSIVYRNVLVLVKRHGGR